MKLDKGLVVLIIALLFGLWPASVSEVHSDTQPAVTVPAAKENDIVSKFDEILKDSQKKEAEAKQSKDQLRNLASAINQIVGSTDTPEIPKKTEEVAKDTPVAPKASIVATNTSAVAGEFVGFDGTAAVGGKISWRVDPPQPFTMIGEGNTKFGVKAAPPFVVVQVVSNGTDYDVAIARIESSSPVPPNPNPNPNPDPEPPLPDGKYKLAAQARTWMNSVPQAARTSSKALANSFRGINSAIAAGTIKTVPDILAQTRTSNNSALGANVDAWKPFGEQMKAALEKLDADGTLRSIDDYRTAWEEIATGLDASAKVPRLVREKN